MAATTEKGQMTAGSCLREAVNPAASPARRSCGGNGHSAHSGHRPGGSPPGYRFALRIARLVALGGLFAVPPALEIARGQELDIEKARYALAVEYCRGDM